MKKSALPIYPSMQACHAATGITKAIQQQAKKDGCPAFDQANRVHLADLLRHLFTEGRENENWADRLKKAQALKAEHELKILDGDHVPRATVRADMTKAASRAIAVLTQKFETELPPKQDGMPAADIAKMNREALFEVRTTLSQPEAYAD